MTIEEFKNQLADAAKEFFTTTAKGAIITGLRDTVLPALKDVADPFVAQLKADATTESGWVKFRDGVFLPGLISAAFWMLDKLLDKMSAADDAVTADADSQDKVQEGSGAPAAQPEQA
jgi:hypothetical protein